MQNLEGNASNFVDKKIYDKLYANITSGKSVGINLMKIFVWNQRKEQK